jgi:hypothetical protein
MYISAMPPGTTTTEMPCFSCRSSTPRLAGTQPAHCSAWRSSGRRSMTDATAPRSGMQNVSSTAASARVRGCGAHAAPAAAAGAKGERASQLSGIVRN